MAQEKTFDWMQYAKDRAKAERELEIEHWVYITFEVRNPDRTRETLHKTDMPRHALDRWRWVIEWRKAKLICKYPRKNIQVSFCYYDKRTGLHTGFDFILGKVTAAKAQITTAERAITNYVNDMTQNDLFFNPETDEKLLKAKAKLEQKRRNYDEMYATLQAEVIKHRETNKYKLFVGFHKLGEFGTIEEAMRYADNSGMSGVFNLIGNRYRDSWHVPQFINAV